MTRKRAFLLLAPLFVAYVGPLYIGDAGKAVAQRRPAADSLAYNLSGGVGSITEKNGEHILEIKDNLKIEHGDVVITSSRGIHYQTRRHTYFIDNVKITQETLTMWGDEGEYRGQTQVAVLRGNVRIVDRGWEVTADSVEYSRATGRVWLRGHVTAKDSTTTLNAGRLLYDRDVEISEAFDTITVSNPDEGFAVHGQHGFYYRFSRQGVVDRRPRLVVDPDSPDPVTVNSDTMRVFPDSGLAIAYYRVKILKGNMVTQCDSAVVFDHRQEALLIGNPLARQGNLAMKGQRIRLFYNDDEVHRVDLLGGAEIREEEPDPLVLDGDSWIRGDTVRMHLHSNAVDSLYVSGKATSEYHPTTPGKVERNLIHGDRMFFRFENDSLTYVRVEGRSEGVYKFVNVSPTETTDSLRALVDTMLTYRSFSRHEEKVVYSAKQIEYYARSNDLVLHQDAMLRYHSNTLTGEDITYYAEHELLDATGEPELKEGAQTFYGQRMNYDLEGETGLVADGTTKFEQGFYKGEYVAKGGAGEMKVWKSVYTTCDLKEPHFEFRAKEMKVYPDDKVVSGPIVLFIGETPIFYLPFMANSISKGRHSGFLRPDFDIGFNSRDGRFIRNIGYYWATNDYTDVTFVGDFNENRSVRLFTENRYRVRYQFDGTINYNFLRDFNDFTNRWELRWRHNQSRMPWDMSFNGNLHYVSDEDVPQTINAIDDVDRVVDRRIESSAALSKSWGRSVRLNVTGRRVQNLNVADVNAVKIDQTVPTVTLSIPSQDLYFGKKSSQGRAGLWEKILSNMRYSPRIDGNHHYTEREFLLTNVTTVNTGLSFSSQPKIGFVTVSPGLNASNTTTRTEKEVLRHAEGPDSNQTIIPYERTVETDQDFRWSGNVGARTNLYGTFYGRVGKLRALRHILSPSATYSYSPARASNPANQSVRLSVRNSFDLKVASDDSTTNKAGVREEGVRKLSSVINWTLSTAYDPDVSRDDAWSNVSSSVTGQFFGVGLTWNHTIDPYTRDILNQNASARVSINGSHPFGKSNSMEVRERNIVAERDTSLAGTPAPSFSIEQTGDTLPGREGGDGSTDLELEEGRLPWSVNTDVSYSTTQFGDPRSTLRMVGQMDLTNTWKVNYSMVYDIFDRQLTAQNIGITRDLHCWQMSLARQKLGQEWQFYFRISLKAHPDIFSEAGRRGLGGGTFGTGSFF